MSDKAATNAEVCQEELDNGIKKHVLRSTWTIAQMYTMYRLEPLLSMIMFGYQRSIVLSWLLFTELVTRHNEVVHAIKAIVRALLRLFAAFHNTVIVHPALKQEAPPTSIMPTIILEAPSRPRTMQTQTQTISVQQDRETANTAPTTRQKARQEAQQPVEGTLESLRTEAKVVFETIFLFFFCMCYSYSPLGIIIFGVIWWMYSRRLEQKKTLQEGGFMTIDAEVVPFLVMWIVATICGAIWPAKIFLFTVLALVHEFHGTWLKERGRKVEREEWLRQTEHRRALQRRKFGA